MHCSRSLTLPQSFNNATVRIPLPCQTIMNNTELMIKRAQDKARSQALLNAVKKNNSKDVARIAPLVNVEQQTQALYEAAHLGHEGCVQALIPFFDQPFFGSEALAVAAAAGHAACVKLLIPYANPLEQHKLYFFSERTKTALHWAAEHGHDDCVALLLAVSDPKHDNSGALQTAVFHQHEECIDLLFEVSDPQMALYALQDVHPDCDWSNFEQRVVHAQRDCLECVVPQKPFNKPRKI